MDGQSLFSRSDFPVVRGFLFIGLIVAWTVATRVATTSHFRQKKPVLSYLTISVVAFLGFTGFVALHAGSIDRRAVFVFAIMSLLSPLAFCAIRMFFRLDARAIEACATWAALESPTSATFLLIPIALGVLVYVSVVVCTIIIPVANPTRFAIQSAVIAFSALGLPAILWVFVRLMATRFWNEEIRTALGVSVFPGVFNAIIILALGLWSFNLAGTGKTLQLLGARITFSPVVVISSLVVVVLFYLLPFVIGHMRGRETLISLQKYRLDTLDKIILELSSPTSTPHVVLGSIRAELEKEMDQFWDKFPVLRIASAIEEDTEPQIPKDLVIFARANDVRYGQWWWCLEVTMKLEEGEKDLAGSNLDVRAGAVSRWSAFFQNLRMIHSKHLAEVSGRKTILVVGATLIVTFLFSKVLEVLWKYLEDWMK
jgi:hypothetical protein